MSSSARQQPPGHSTCRVGLLLTLPNGLEADFWSASGTRAALRCIDIVACSLPFINLVLIASRRIKHNLPSGLTVPLGAKLLLGGYMFISLVTLVLALTHPAAYKKHRMSLTKLGRCWRLVSEPGHVCVRVCVSPLFPPRKVLCMRSTAQHRL
jgi:hypothetical protein